MNVQAASGLVVGPTVAVTVVVGMAVDGWCVIVEGKGSVAAGTTKPRWDAASVRLLRKSPRGPRSIWVTWVTLLARASRRYAA